ncbi:MAG: hypothetical protein KAX19_04630 [Candidatus Brocadiae bacterium]|nr:hypothetical protein [Candidatus Brocadiia bacterium]
MAHPAQAAALAELLRRAAGGGAVSENDAGEALCHVRADPVTGAFRGLGVDLTDRARERLEFFRRTAGLCPAVRLDVAGHEVEAVITDVELWRFYLPICQALDGMAAKAERRVLVGIAGAGASGKSVFAGLLREALNRTLSGQASAALCPLDGFHFPNAYLDSHFTQDEQGRRVAMRALKGAPRTFDAESFVPCLRRLRRQPSVDVPRYDRRLHDPVPGGIHVRPEHRVVLVEGNYLLLDTERWAPVAGLLDLSLFMAQSLEVVRDAMIRRHVRGGRTEEDALGHFERVDRRNFDVIASTAPRADLLVRRSSAHHVVAIEAPPG